MGWWIKLGAELVCPQRKFRRSEAVLLEREDISTRPQRYLRCEVAAQSWELMMLNAMKRLSITTAAAALIFAATMAIAQSQHEGHRRRM